MIIGTDQVEKLRNKRGVTLIELLVTSLLVSVVFLAVASCYLSGLRLMRSIAGTGSSQSSAPVNPSLAMHLMSKNIALANKITIASPGPASGGQLTITLDYILNASGVPGTPNVTSSAADDSTIVYSFSGSPITLTSYYYNAGSSASSSQEVVSGLQVTSGSFTLFNPVNNVSNAVTISIQSGGKTLGTTVTAGAASKG